MFKEYVLINCKPNTQVGYKRLIKNHIKPKIGIYKLNKITPAKLQELINNLEDLKIITLEQYNTILKKFPYGSNMYLPLQIGFSTRMRVGAVMSLTWDCIDLESKTIKIEKNIISK